MGRPKIHDERTAAALLDAAEKLLASEGPDAVSVRAVADAVATSTRAVYSVFGGKEGLIRRLCQRGYEVLTELVDAVPITDDPASDLIEIGLRGFRTFATTRPHLFRLTFERVTADLTADPSVSASAWSSYQTLVSRIARVPTGGRPVETVAFQFHSLCQGLATSELQAQPPPVGSHFWRMVPDVGPSVWRDALATYVHGLGQPQPR